MNFSDHGKELSTDVVERRLAAKMGCSVGDSNFRATWTILQEDEKNMIRDAKAENELGRMALRQLASSGREILEAGRRFARAKENQSRLDTALPASAGLSDQGAELQAGLAPRNARRASAMGRPIAKVAESQSSVTRFRTSVLAGYPLGIGEAEAFLLSPAASRVHADRFGFHGIPPVHQARLLSEEESPDGSIRAKLWIDPCRFVEDADLGVEFKHLCRRMDVKGEIVYAWPRSPLHDLSRVAEELARVFPWTWFDSLWFALTATVPKVNPLRVGLRSVQSREDAPQYRRGVVRMEIEPWLSPEEVEHAYRMAQRAMIPKEQRAFSERSIEVFRWVEEQRSVRPELSLSTLQTLWNRRTDIGDADRFVKRSNTLADIYARTSKRLMTPETIVPNSDRAAGR